MKKTNLLTGATAILALALTACSSDLPNGGSKVTENEETRYVTVVISNPTFTRASEFEIGTDAENQIQDVYFVFYDEYGDVVGRNSIVDIKLTEDGQLTVTPNTPQDGDPQSSVGQIATTTLQLEIPKGSNPPKYVMAFLNPVDFGEVSSQENINSLRDSKRKNYLCGHNKFAMNNSAYYGTNLITGAENVKILGAPVLEGQLHETLEAANAANSTPIEIYVERYAAKVRLTMIMESDDENKGIKPQIVGEGDRAYTLMFVPEVWTVNADAPEMYASKRFENSNAANHDVPTFNEVQTMLGTWSTWNDAPNHRSYWACSPGYYATQFPTVSDDIIENAPDGKTGAGIEVSPYNLLYYSYNQITGTSNDPNDPNKKSKGLGNTYFSDDGSNRNCKYVLENTMGADAFKCANPKAAAPSALIVGHYDIYSGEAVDATKKVASEHGFCIYAGNLYFIEEEQEGYAPSANSIKGALLNRNGILFTDQSGEHPLTAASTAPFDCLEVCHPTKDVRDGQNVPHRYVTLQLKYLGEENADKYTGLYYRPAGSDNLVPVQKTDSKTLEEVITEINKFLWAQLGNARIYRGNKAYFSIPIQHLGITERNYADLPKPIDSDGFIIWKEVRVGDFGLVRNHVYTIQVDGIKGIGSGIDGPDNPLVPSMEDEEYWLNYKINILGWRVVPTQGGIILK